MEGLILLGGCCGDAMGGGGVASGALLFPLTQRNMHVCHWMKHGFQLGGVWFAV